MTAQDTLNPQDVLRLIEQNPGISKKGIERNLGRGEFPVRKAIEEISHLLIVDREWRSVRFYTKKHLTRERIRDFLSGNFEHECCYLMRKVDRLMPVRMNAE